MNRQHLLYPQSAYHGRQQPPHVAFNASLQAFSQHLNYISGLHTGGKISSLEAFSTLDTLWQHLEADRRALRLLSTGDE